MRLLSLLDGKIETFTSVENAPPFAAISYVWPTHLDPAITWTTANITLRSGLWATLHMKWSVPSCTPFQLDAALRAVYCAAIQVPDKDLPFSPVSLRFNHIWMDVLCIDQSSDDDKAKEVRYMRDYYSKAQSVYVFLNTLGQGDLPLLPEGPARWFQRLWTLQECVLPTNLYFYAMIPALNVSRWIDRKFTISLVHGMLSRELYSPTVKDYFSVGVQFFALAVRNPTVQVALQLSSVRQCRYDHDRVMGILGMIDDSMIDKDGIKCDYKKPKQDTFASFLQAMPINVLMDAFATTAPPPDMIGSADSSRLSFFGFIERTMSIVGGSRTFLKLEEAERVLTRAHPINSTGDHLQQVPGEPELPVLPSFDPSQGVTMHASIVPVIGTSDHGYSAAANFASGMMSFAGLIGRKMTNQYVLHYIFAASKLLRVDYEAMSWGAVQIFKFQERRKPGLLNDIVNTYKTIGEFFQQGYREGDIYLPLFYGPQVKHKRIWLPSGAVLAGQGSWPDWIDGATRDVLEGRIFLVLMGNSECDNKLNFPTPSKCWAVCERVHGPRGFVVRKVGVFHSIETHSESTSNYVHHFQGWVTVA